MVKTLDTNIKEAFGKLGFAEEEVKEGCWLLERKGKPVAWIALHKFLERVASRAGIQFQPPVIVQADAEKKIAVIIVTGTLSEATEWSFGEATPDNNKNEYTFSMAEKRAKDRVILKLVGLHGSMYSEEEADDFKDKPEPVTAYNGTKKGTSREMIAKFVAVKKEIEASKTLSELTMVWNRVQNDLKEIREYDEQSFFDLEATKDRMKEKITGIKVE